MLTLGSSSTRAIHWHTVVPSLLIPGSNVLDLGANVGRFSEDVVRNFDCICHAVERDPELMGQIPRHPRIKTYRYAIAAEPGSLVLHRSANRLGASVVTNTFNSPAIVDLAVQGIDLQSFVNLHIIGPISLIKMDIEGAEVDVMDSL